MIAEVRPGTVKVRGVSGFLSGPEFKQLRGDWIGKLASSNIFQVTERKLGVESYKGWSLRSTVFRMVDIAILLFN